MISMKEWLLQHRSELVAWASAGLIIGALLCQIWKQWREGGSRNVSAGMFVLQVLSSSGFAWYSYTVSNRVFLASNIANGTLGLVGLLLIAKHRGWLRRARRGWWV